MEKMGEGGVVLFEGLVGRKGGLVGLFWSLDRDVVQESRDCVGTICPAMTVVNQPKKYVSRSSPAVNSKYHSDAQGIGRQPLFQPGIMIFRRIAKTKLP